MDTLPSGTVTFCFTDIEGSTRLFAQLGERYEALLAEHRRLIHEAVAAFGGVEIKTEGDGGFIVFQDALAAVKAAGAMQQAVDGHGWPDNARIRIRIGVHTGEAQPSGRDYVSLAVHQAARVADTGHGGQVIVSAQTAAFLTDDTLAPFHLAELGEYRLRSFDEACHLYQLAGPGLVGAFPPLRTRAAVSKRVRIFLSSPGDVRSAREIAALTIERLAQDYARFFAIEPYFWDYEAMLAAGRFQDPDEPPGAFDIVVLIVWSRLGTPLPERTAMRVYHGIDDRAPLTGTEWEFEDALKASVERGAPDLLIYRSGAPVHVDSRDVARRQQDIDQLAALDRFWSQHFANQGAFTGAYTEFESDAEFADALEKQLRQLIDKRIAGESSSRGDQSARVWLQAPFRGLESYEFEHAPIFFGQDEALARAMVQLVENADAGSPFLLLLGASGSGKSSLVKAGIVPKLFVPRRIPGAAFLRRVVFRPSDAQEGEDLFDALARRLTTQLSEREGFCELIGPEVSVANLAAHLRSSTTEPALPFRAALGQLASKARHDGRMLEYETARLVLVIDQLEELFTNELLTTQERQQFVSLLAGLVRSGVVWVVATMRKDFWHQSDETPELVQLAQDKGRLELLPPTQSQLSQMIRRPAAAAGVGFEHHASTDVPLNEVIAEEVAHEPGALPLLSYLMDQLYRTDVLEAQGNVLTYATYEKLGRLEGAIATKAEAVLEACAPEDRQALGGVLFALVQMGTTDGDIERAVSRRIPLANFPAGTPQRRLVEALLHPDARLLVSDTDVGGHPTVRVAHEALITRWERARDFVQGNAQALKIRRRVEERYALWRDLDVADNDTANKSEATPLRAKFAAWRSRFGHEPGLLSEIDLIDGQRLLREHRNETEPHLVDYIERSAADDKRMRTRTVRVLSVIVSIVTVLAVLASGAGLIASQKQHEAERQRQQAAQAQSRALTEAASQRLSNGDFPGAQGIILPVLTETGSSEGQSAAAINVFQEARAADVRLAVLVGHDNTVYSAAWSPDGRRIVTASADKTARIWDATSGLRLLVLSGHGSRVRSAAWSPDGKRIVTASYDKTARIWDASTGKQLITFSDHEHAVYSAAWSPDGSRIVSAFGDKTARIWDAATGKQLSVLSGHDNFVVTADWSPDGRRVVTASEDNTARIWDAVSGKQLVVLSGHGNFVVTAAYSPDGQRIVTASEDGTARIWDASSGKQLAVLSGNGGDVLSATWSPDGRRIVTAMGDRTARIWDAATDKQLAVLAGHDASVYCAAWSPDGRRIVTASKDKTARTWDAATAGQLAVLSGHDNFILSSAWSPDGRRIVTASSDKTARIWDAATARQLTVISGHEDFVNSAAYSPDNRRILTASDDKTARVWGAASGRQLAALTGHDAGVASAGWSPDGRRIVTASQDKSARIWDAATARQLVVLSGHGDHVNSAVYSADGRRIVTASDDKTARIWDAAAGKQLVVLSGHDNFVETAAWSSDGRRIVTASADKTARVWDAATGKQLIVLAGHDKGFLSAAWSPDEQRIVTTADDRTARIWDAVTGKQLMVLADHADNFFNAAYSPDGLRIVTASMNRIARIWDAKIPADLNHQIAWSTAAEFDSLSAVARTELGVPPNTRIRLWPNAHSLCDSAAGAPYDPDRRMQGVVQRDIATDVAIPACAREIATSGNSPRLIYELGRAQIALHDLGNARQAFETAVSGGNRAAQIDLANLLADPSTGMFAPARAISLYERAWQAGVTIAAFKLGQLYEYGARGTGAAAHLVLQSDAAKAWSWYRKGANIGEPNALARFGAREDENAVAENSAAKQKAILLDAFRYFAAAAERAEDEDWPDDAWKNWRYRRATLARLLARDGMMQQVADAYTQVRDKWQPHPPTLMEKIAGWLRL